MSLKYEPSSEPLQGPPWDHGRLTGRAASMAHVRQSRPDAGHGFHGKVLKPFLVVPSSLGNGRLGLGFDLLRLIRYYCQA